MTDDQRKELAEQYRVMMGLGAWKHFSEILSRLEEQATKDEDNVPLEEVSMLRIAECRGTRKAIDRIRNEVEYIVNGLR